MYYLIDMNTGKTVAQRDSRDGIMMAYLGVTNNTKYRFLLRDRKLDFTYLNITGKDITTGMERTGEYYWNPELRYSFPVYAKVTRLRPFMVIDEYGRSQDIRLWTDVIKRINSGIYPPVQRKNEPQPRFRIDPAGYGRKYNNHRVNLRAMLYQQMKLQTEPVDEDMLDIRPIIDKSNVRKRVSEGEAWDSYEDKIHNKYSSSKSWKDQSKSHRQWAKQKPGSKRRNWRKPHEHVQTVEEIAANCGIPLYKYIIREENDLE